MSTIASDLLTVVVTLVATSSVVCKPNRKRAEGGVDAQPTNTKNAKSEPAFALPAMKDEGRVIVAGFYGTCLIPPRVCGPYPFQEGHKRKSRKSKDGQKFGGTKEHVVIPPDEQRGAMIPSAYSIDVNEDERSHEKKSASSKENSKGKVDHKKTTTKKNLGSGKNAGLPWAHKKRNP